MKDKTLLYDIIIIVLAILSIVLILLDFMNIITLTTFPFMQLEWSITLFFAADYVTRFYYAQNKWHFVKNNIWDLVAIIPFDTLFAIFRLGRILRLMRLSKLSRFSRLFSMWKRLKRHSFRFLKTNGLIYILYINATLIILASIIISLVEKSPYDQSLWWAIVTTTTVGYGDIVPQTLIGKVTAVVLMLIGIGTIGMLTSSLTHFFIHTNDPAEHESELDNLRKELQEHKQLLNQILDKLEQSNVSD